MEHFSGAQKSVNPSECSIVLEKYDLKHDVFITQVLKLDKESPIKQMSFTILVHVSIEENYPKLHISVWQKYVKL